MTATLGIALLASAGCSADAPSGARGSISSTPSAVSSSSPGTAATAEACPTEAPWSPTLPAAPPTDDPSPDTTDDLATPTTADPLPTTTDGVSLPPSSDEPTTPTTAVGVPEHDNRAPLVALDPATGAVRWHVCPGPWAFSDVAVSESGMLVVRGRSFAFASPSLPCGTPADPVTLALAGDSGTVAWAADDQEAWAFYDDPPKPVVRADVVIIEGRAIDVPSGEVLWDATGLTHDGDPVRVTTDGTETFRDRRTGAVVDRPDEPEATAPPVRRDDQPSLVGDNGVQVTVENGTTSATAPDGSTRWSIPTPTNVVEVRAVTDDIVVVAGAKRIPNCP